MAEASQVGALLRSWGGVVVLGAGVSYEHGYPLLREIPNLLWVAVDADPTLLERLAQDFGVPKAPAVRLIDKRHDRIEHAFGLLSSYPEARQAFQDAFVELDRKKAQTYSPAHAALAELLHRQAISLVVSLNWDTLLERAHQERYGVPLRSDGEWLSKPHGDVANPTDDWILPFAEGYAPDALRERIMRLHTGQPGLLLIIGYSEGDRAIVDAIIAPVSDHWQVVRVGPSATSDSDIGMPADQALPLILKSACPSPETPGWEYVTFHTGHTLGDALSGRGLGPGDVQICPKLPEVWAAYRRLLTTSSVEIEGGSGCGKSLTAYQVAHRFQKAGIEVLRLVLPSTETGALLASVANLPHPSLVLIDDAHTVDPGLIRGLIERACQNLRVVLVSTRETAHHIDSVVVVGERAVRAIADNFLQRRAEVLRTVRQIDPMVGDGPFQIDIEARIEHAAKTSRTPWQFCFTVAGGWAWTSEHLVVLAAADGADLLLGAIALRQVLDLDRGVTTAWLARATRLFGRDSMWESDALASIRGRRLLLDERGLVRCPHRLFAEFVLQDLTCSSPEARKSLFRQVIIEALGWHDPPLAGVASLLDVLYLGSPPATPKPGILDDEIYAAVLLRCWSAGSNTDRGSAARVLDRLIYWRPDFFSLLEEKAALIGSWIQCVDRDSARGLGDLINEIFNTNPELAMTICRHVDPSVVAATISRADVAATYDFGYLLGRLHTAAVAAPFGDSQWLQRLRDGLDVSALEALATGIAPKDVPAYCELNEAVLGLQPRLGLWMLERASAAIAQAVEEAPLRLFSSLHLFLHGANICDVDASVPPTVRLFATVSPRKIAEHLCASRPRDWFTYHSMFRWLEIVVPGFKERVYDEVDFDRLDTLTDGLWSAPPGQLNLLIMTLGLSPTGEPARSWVNRHMHELTHVTGEIAAIAPEAAIVKLQEGLSIDLGPEHFDHWRRAIRALQGLASVDPAIAREVAEANHEAFVRGISDVVSASSDPALLPFLHYLGNTTPEVLQLCLNAVSPPEVRGWWIERLQSLPTD